MASQQKNSSQERNAVLLAETSFLLDGSVGKVEIGAAVDAVLANVRSHLVTELSVVQENRLPAAARLRLERCGHSYVLSVDSVPAAAGSS